MSPSGTDTEVQTREHRLSTQWAAKILSGIQMDKGDVTVIPGSPLFQCPKDIGTEAT